MKATLNPTPTGHATPHAPGAKLLDWLVTRALPMWSTTGVDSVAGGYHEKIDLQGLAVAEPRRTRVVARQVYVFATAARRGWAPGAHAIVEHGLEFLLQRSKLSDGTFAAAVEPDGTVVDDRFDLYEQAFALFALAAACRGRDDRNGLRAEAESLLRVLRTRFGHPDAGFEEAVPRSLPLRANPHMHLLEAALAWEDISTGAQRAPWSSLADELAELCLARMIDPATGALRENFDGHWHAWSDAQGQMVEPGHQFEWAWLLMRWAAARVRPDAARAAERLLEIGEGLGVDRLRGVALNSLDDRLKVSDAAAKLWPQTERIKAWHQAGGCADAARAEVAHRNLEAGVAGLSRYLLSTPAGLWHEVMNADGTFAPQHCRASSLYHIVCAIDTLQDAPARPARSEAPA